VSATLPLDDGFLRPEELAELRQTFFDQGREALEALGHDVLALEGQAPSAERLITLRRAAHTLKGDCASVGFAALSTLAHALEDAFVAIETVAEPVPPVQIDVLLSAVDALRNGLEAGARGRLGPNVEPVVERLQALLASGGTAASWLAGLTIEDRRRALEAQTAGAAALRVAVFFKRACRNRVRTAHRLMEALGDELIAAVGLERVKETGQLDLLVATHRPAVDVVEAMASVKGIQARVDPCVLTSPSAPTPADLQNAEGGHDGETVRIEAGRIDEVLTLVGELLSVRSALAGLAVDIEPHLPDDLGRRMSDTQSLLGRVLQDLQRSTMRMRMVPAERVFRRFVRVVRDLGRDTGKPIRLAVEGESTELDRGILDALEEPLLHLVRNAVTHGIEDPAERAADGKPAEGRLIIRAGREGNQILIEVADDGRGIDADAVRARAVQRELVTVEEAAAMPDSEARQLVFQPGLSTAAALTEHSGRGVGLDVVRSTVESLRGSVSAEVAPEGGALFVIRVPLTIAIIQALLFRVSGRPLAVPLSSVVEIARVQELDRQCVGEVEIFRRRDQVIGLVRLSRLLGLPQGDGPGYVMVLRCGGSRFGLLVDEMVGEQELVIKRVHDRWIRTPLVAGASIVGGGVPTLILDVLSVYRCALSQGVLPA
jgi:two-component system chemotaxis sensor kinase CheA